MLVRDLIAVLQSAEAKHPDAAVANIPEAGGRVVPCGIVVGFDPKTGCVVLLPHSEDFSLVTQ